MREDCLLQPLDARTTIWKLQSRLHHTAPGRVARLVLLDSGGLSERVNWPLLSYLLLKTPLLPWLATRLTLDRPALRHSLENRLFKRKVADIGEIIEDVSQKMYTKKSVYCDWQMDENGLRRNKTCHLPQPGQARCPTLLIYGDDLSPPGTPGQRRKPSGRQAP